MIDERKRQTALRKVAAERCRTVDWITTQMPLRTARFRDSDTFNTQIRSPWSPP